MDVRNMVEADGLPVCYFGKYEQCDDPNLREYSSQYNHFWRVTDQLGRTWYLAKGHEYAPRQVVVWYPNGKFFSGFGFSRDEALAKALNMAWAYL